MKNAVYYESDFLLKTHRCVFEGIINMSDCYFKAVKADELAREVRAALLLVRHSKGRRP